jgi:hypothetical protein
MPLYRVKQNHKATSLACLRTLEVDVALAGDVDFAVEVPFAEDTATSAATLTAGVEEATTLTTAVDVVLTVTVVVSVEVALAELLTTFELDATIAELELELVALMSQFLHVVCPAQL